MSKPRVSPPANHQATGNVLRDSSLALVPETLEPYAELNKAIWFDGPLKADELEMIRLRNAQKVGCVFCKAVRYDIATEAGLSESKISQIDDDYAQSELSYREKLILRYTDYYLDNPNSMSAEFATQLQGALKPNEIAHMQLALALFNVMTRGAVAFGGMPNQDLPPMAISVPE